MQVSRTIKRTFCYHSSNTTFVVKITQKPKIKSLFWVLEKAVLASLNQTTRNPSFVASLNVIFFNILGMIRAVKCV